MISADRLAVLGVTVVVLSGCGTASTDESQASSASTAVPALSATAGTVAPSSFPTQPTASTSTTLSVDGSATTSSIAADVPPIAPSTGGTVNSGPLAVSPSTIVASTEEANVTPAAHFEPALQALVNQAIADLATRLGIDSTVIVVNSAEFVVWPDKSLGCPQPGMGYNQVTVDGSLIELSVGSTTYRYHSGGSRSPFLCQKG